MAAAAASATGAAALPVAPSPVKAYVGYATTLVFSDLKMVCYRDANANGKKWVKDFTLANVAWRVSVMPCTDRMAKYTPHGRGFGFGMAMAPHAEVTLQLLQPGCVVALDRLDVQLVGLGQCFPAEHKDVTFSTTQRNAAPADKVLCSGEHSKLPRPRQFNSLLSPGTVLPDDCLELRIEMRPSARPCFPDARALPPVNPQQTLTGLMANLYGAATGSEAVPTDVTLKFSGMHAQATPVPAHSFLLSLRSSVFRAQFHGAVAPKGPPFTCIVPEEVSPSALALLLQYFCTDAIAAVTFGDAAALLAAAEYYQLPRLVLLCDKILELALCADTALETLALAHRFGRNGLRTAALCCAAEHVDALLDTPAWALLPAPLQHAVVRTVSNHGEPATIKEPAAQADAEPEPAAKRTRA